MRLLLTTLGIAVAVGLLLLTIGGFNGLKARDLHSGWLQTSIENQRPSVDESTSDPLWWWLSADTFEGKSITIVQVAATGPRSPLIPGLERQPAPGEYYVSPALAELLDSTPPELLGDRFPARRAGVLGEEGLVSPVSLIAVVGRTPAQMAQAQAMQVKSLETAPKNHDYSELLQVALGIGAIGLMLPVLVFVITSTRLAAARREERLAALRLVGATPGQVNLIAAVEAVLAAIVGTALGFALFYVFRPAVARIPFTGEPFFTADVSAGWLAIVGAAIGVPAVGVIAGLVTLRRVRISPLGVTRKAPACPPRPVSLLVLAVGVVLLLIGPGRLSSGLRNTSVFVVFALIALGIMVAGPWLTYVGGRLLARIARRDSTLIAARRLTGDPRRSFRAISGLVLAVFVGTVFVTMIATAMGNNSGSWGTRDLPDTAMFQQLGGSPDGYLTPAKSQALVTDVAEVEGVQAVVQVLLPALPEEPAGESDGTALGTAVLVSAADWERLGGPPDAVNASGYAVFDMNALSQGLLVKVTAEDWSANGDTAAYDALTPGANGQTADLVVLTDGASTTIERVRTVLETATFNASVPYTYAEQGARGDAFIRFLGRLVYVGVILCLIIAGCTLAVSVVGGLVERRRAFALLRLAGMPLGRLYRTVILEAAVPLVLAAVISAGVGFLVAALIIVTTGGGFHISSPGLGYFALVVGGLLAALVIVAATLPLVRRMTEPHTARME